MSATDALKRGFGTRGAIRAVEPDPEGVSTAEGQRPSVIRCAYRPEGSDFYCWKYGVWYNLMDCCNRHDERTYSGCADCGQGRGNLRQNLNRYRTLREKPRSAHGP